ncbi:hypothetical protein ACWA1F_00380 [Flavobacterium sp. 3-218]
MTNENIIQTAFDLNVQFVANINTMNFENLNSKFEINQAVFEEIKEELFDYFGTDNLPKLKILITDFIVFKYNSGEKLGIEAKLFTEDNKETELTLHTEFYNNSLRFKLIEVM